MNTTNKPGRGDKTERDETENDRATRYDGNPNPEGDDDGGLFKPPDSTPSVLPVREGVRKEPPAKP